VEVKNSSSWGSDPWHRCLWIHGLLAISTWQCNLTIGVLLVLLLIDVIGACVYTCPGVLLVNVSTTARKPVSAKGQRSHENKNKANWLMSFLIGGHFKKSHVRIDPTLQSPKNT
jgi:hypothetical protein